MSYEELKRPDRIDEDKITKLKELFPEAFRDGELNLDILKEEISMLDNDLINDEEEFYSFNWIGKKEARKLSFLPPQGTLTFSNNEGVNEQHTKNAFIEGDNLEVLRILQKSYSNRVKCIYIDPPYNTGKEFVYKDDYKDPVEKFFQKTGQADEEGLLTSNPKSSGRYHANWLSMMYPRLKLARNLLRKDGVIFVSIDDNEQANLKKLMDEIFGEENFVTSIVWQKKYSPQNDATYFSDMHDYLLVYAKNKKSKKTDDHGWERNLLPRTEKQNSLYKNPDNDPRGRWKSGDLLVKTYSSKYDYPIITPSGREVHPSNGRCWRVSKQKFEEMVDDGRIWFGKDGNSIPSVKRFLSEVQQGNVPTTWWTREDCGDNQEATQNIRDLFPNEGALFDTPKPVRLIKRIIELSTKKDSEDIVLDFFAGSGTTAQAVLETNEEDSGNRKFICIQLPDKTQNKHYGTIADVTKERIRRAINYIYDKSSNKSILDRGFSVFKMSRTHLKQWSLYEGESMDELEDILDFVQSKPFTQESKPFDIAIELMLTQGFPLDSHIEEKREIWEITHQDVPFSLLIDLSTELDQTSVDYLINEKADSTFICLDQALSNQQKVLLSERLRVKTI
ncbi:site-specific DNA-methyltransferase [Halobacillus sp. HZG1]|uniref:site-specific DNA-methyltransferase n=1 Tax=Halobacillus sp. HZG1 TaxID=3111769 RepID=UPI002DB55920|nr:site-specific DNA-methyltransferase [Halobacillus sp. HZG1]MEC3885506.1 site-specific DNA-methyltransferase [Halobacillus sp. HZG1]